MSYQSSILFYFGARYTVIGCTMTDHMRAVSHNFNLNLRYFVLNGSLAIDVVPDLASRGQC